MAHLGFVFQAVAWDNEFMAMLPVTGIILIGQKTIHLKKVIDSLAWTSELILFDNNSGYDFSQLSGERMHRISESEPISDFSAIRQELQARATQPWVFFVDSDEVVQVISLLELAKQLENPSLHGLSVMRSDVFLGKALEYGEAGDQPLVRMIRPEYTRWQNAVHEVAVVSGQLAVAPIRIDHHSHESISEFVGQVIEYSKLAAQSRSSTPAKNLMELLFFPPLKLFYGLVIQGGALDGWRGVIYAFCMSLHSLLVRIYWYESHQVLEKPQA